MLLNELLASDPVAMRALLGHRVVCSATLMRKHLVPFERDYDTGRTSFGLVDVLNALFGASIDGKGPIALVRDEAGVIVALAEVTDS